MPWCPECREEYREGFEKCGVCNTELVSSLEEETNNYRDDVKEVFLTSVGNELEAVMVESQLQLHGIPVLKKHKGAGEYLSISRGMSNLGIDLFVPSPMLENAKEIIIGVNNGGLEMCDSDNTEEESSNDWEDEYRKKRQRRVLLIILVPLITTFLLLMIINIMQ